MKLSEPSMRSRAPMRCSDSWAPPSKAASISLKISDTQLRVTRL